MTTAIAAAISWFVSSEIFVVLISVLVGFLSSYLLQTLTQKKAWEREYSAKIAEEVYGGLFRDLKRVNEYLEKKAMLHLGFTKWTEVKDDHRYFMIEEKFRKRLNVFSKRIEEFNIALIELSNKILPKIIIQEANRAFTASADSTPQFIVNYVENNRKYSSAPDIVRCLITDTHPKEEALGGKNLSEISNVKLVIGFLAKGHSSGLRGYSFDRLDDFWESCMERKKKEKTWQFVIEENNKLRKEAKGIMQELVKRIEKPWKI